MNTITKALLLLAEMFFAGFRFRGIGHPKSRTKNAPARATVPNHP
jgi:hypothetical protein